MNSKIQTISSATVAAVLAFACAAPSPLTPEYRVSGTPATPAGESIQADVGAVLLEQSFQHLLPSIHVNRVTSVRDDIEVPTQQAVAYWKYGEWLRYALSIRILPKPGDVIGGFGAAVALDLVVDEPARQRHKAAAFIKGSWLRPGLDGERMGRISLSLEELPDEWSLGETPSAQHDQFRQELTYLGHSDNRIRVLYREYTHDFLKFAYNTEIVYDLSEGPIFGFRGARIEVIDADNQRIHYRVLQPFPAVRTAASPTSIEEFAD